MKRDPGAVSATPPTGHRSDVTSEGALRRMAGGIALVVALMVLSACGSTDDPAPTASPDHEQIEGIVRPEPLEVGSLSLTEVSASGSARPFRFEADDGQLLFVAFGYTNCPDVCPTTLYDIKRARRQMGDRGDRVEVAFATVDPDRDTPEILATYLGSFTAGGHPLRTVDRTALETVEEGFGITSSVTEQADGTIDVSHTARSFVVDDRGKVVVEWAFGTEPEAMANDLEILLDQQSARS